MEPRGDSNETEVEMSSIGSVLLNATPHALANAVRVVSRHHQELNSGGEGGGDGGGGTRMPGDVGTAVPAEGPSAPPHWEDGFRRRDPLYVIVPITIIYGLIFLSGVVGNVSTCIVIAKNKHMHTATNYYLFNLAVSDLLLLVSGIPPEMYHTWSPSPYVFGEAFCVVQSFAAETSANATVLTITAFTVERYVAICHPLRSHTLSGLSRAVKLVVATWVAAVCLAVPQAIQFGVVYVKDRHGRPIEGTAQCSMKRVMVEHVFAISTCVFFVAPMTLITALYVLIGLRLRSSRMLTRRSSGGSMRSDERKPGWKSSQNHVIRMLVAVVVAFFICWAPFHAQRLLAVYADSKELPSDVVVTVYSTLTYVSGILYYLSTTVNPVLYHIMSLKFKEAFKETLVNHCGWSKYSVNHKHSELAGRRSMRLHHERHTSSTSLQVLGGRQGCVREGTIPGRELMGRRMQNLGRAPRTRAVALRCGSSGGHAHSYFFPGEGPEPATSKLPDEDATPEEAKIYAECEAIPGQADPFSVPGHSALLQYSPEGSLSSAESVAYLPAVGNPDAKVVLSDRGEDPSLGRGASPVGSFSRETKVGGV